MKISWTIGSGSKPGGFQPGLDHAQPAIRHDGAAERRVGLKADDDLVVAIDVTRLVRGQRGWRFDIDVQNPFVDLLFEIGLQLGPDGFRALAGTCEKRLVPIIGSDVALDEVADVDRVLPTPGRRNLTSSRRTRVSTAEVAGALHCARLGFEACFRRCASAS